MNKHRLAKTASFALGLTLSLTALFGGVSTAHAQADTSDYQAGDLRAPSPAIVNWDRPGYIQVGVGPSFASGLDSSSTMYNVNASYNYNMSPSFTGKAIADFNFGSASSPARWTNLGLGLDAYFSELDFVYGAPYVGVDLGFGFVRNENEAVRDAVTAGATVGFKFMVEQMNFDVNAHYGVLTAEIDNRNPTIFAVRLSTQF